MSNEFFPQRPNQNPTIYAYEILEASNRKGLLKVGFIFCKLIHMD